MLSDIACSEETEDPAGKTALTPSPASLVLKEEGGLPGAVKERRALMGTVFTATVIPPEGMNQDAIRKVLTEAFLKAEELQAAASTFDAESELSRLNRTEVGKERVLSPELFTLLERACRMAELSRGAFDPTLGAASRLWRRSRSRGALPGDADLKKALAGCGYEKLKLNPATRSVVREHPGMLVDLGGIGKGAALDLMAASLRGNGIPCFRLSTTSDILVGDAPPGRKFWKIGLSPSGKEVELTCQAVSTSGTFHQFVLVGGKKYAHLIDPATGLGTTREAGVSVIAGDAATADAGATALIFLKPEQRKGFCLSAGIKEFIMTEPNCEKDKNAKN